MLAMKFEIVEVGPERIEEIIELDEAISWEYVDDAVKEGLSYDEYCKRHRELFLSIYRGGGEHHFFAALDEKGSLVGLAWICLKMDTVNYVDTCYIFDIEVKREYRGLGTDSALM